MPSATPLLPASPTLVYKKPTLSNTEGGKRYTPTHPDLLRVVFESSIQGEGFSSRLVAVRDIPPNSLVAPLTNITQAPTKAYSSVQYGASSRDHLELNSDLLFMNHSCAPSVYMNVSSRHPADWQVVTGDDGLKEGQDITFFYPSTEWDMAQGFDCSCGAEECLQRIQGAKYISLDDLEKRGWVNEHIRRMKEAQESP
ncbi:hypothetical protein P7C73_g6401, partial [Tremellales sp. Uapishka_1]